MDKVKYWTKHLADWQASGLSQKDYCAQQDIKAHNLYYWRQKLATGKKQTQRLIPVMVQQATPVRVVLCDRTIIELSSDNLSTVLLTLKERNYSANINEKNVFTPFFTKNSTLQRKLQSAQISAHN